MALPSLLTDRDFLYFKHLLGTGEREALSYLDWLWLQLNISGDPNFHSADHVEAMLQWKGKRGVLVKHLIACHFLKGKRGGGYVIADWESRLMDWGKKRLRRKTDPEAAAAAGRRPLSAESAPYDLDPPIPFPKMKMKPSDHDPKPRKDRDRQETASQEGGRAPKNPISAPLGRLEDTIRAIGGANPPRSRDAPPPPTQPIGTYTARECALAAAALDKDLPPDQARAMWITRAAEVSQYTGGLEFFRDLLSAIHNAQIQGNPKGVGQVRHPGRFLNAKTHSYLERKRAS